MEKTRKLSHRKRKTRKHSDRKRLVRNMKGGNGMLRPGYTESVNEDGTPYYVRSRNGKSTWNYPEGNLPNGYKEKITNDGRLRYKGPNGRKWNQGTNDNGVIYYTSPRGNSFNSVWELPVVNMKELGKKEWEKMKKKQTIEALQRQQVEEAEKLLETQKEQARLWALQKQRAERFGWNTKSPDTKSPGTKSPDTKSSSTRNSGAVSSDLYQGLTSLVPF